MVSIHTWREQEANKIRIFSVLANGNDVSSAKKAKMKVAKENIGESPAVYP
jgi:hypothetical protein